MYVDGEAEKCFMHQISNEIRLRVLKPGGRTLYIELLFTWTCLEILNGT